jgi:phosphatidylserine/phosphatidylglycerophosphate/cardiolipin synthase-like enzyme
VHKSAKCYVELWAVCVAAALGGSCVLRADAASSSRDAALAEPSLVITEVAQSTAYGGNTTDKVEVVCVGEQGCAVFRVCDSTADTGTCSAPQPALGGGERRVVSRGQSVAAADQVWLADDKGQELSGSRVGPFVCDAGTSQARSDCAAASFGPCATPSLGVGQGGCTSEPAEASASIEVLFTQNQHGGPEPSCTRPLCQRLVAAISSAQSTLDFAIYGLRNQNAVIDALVEAQVRGVRVRGVVDTEGDACDQFEYQDTGLLLQRLAPGSVVCDSGPGHGYIMHDKFFVIDEAAVWTGSTNISDTELGGEYYADAAVLAHSEDLAAVYSHEFAEMYAGKFHTHKLDDTPHVLAPFADGTQLESYFSPSDAAVENAVLPLIAHAQQSLDVAMFFFTDARIAASLADAYARGVKLRMVLDASGAENKYSKHRQLCDLHVPVKVEHWGGKSHSKWAVADAADPAHAAVLVGSLNWTGAANEHNDENTLVIRSNRAVSDAFAREFERQWSDLPDSLICADVAAEGPGSSDCGPDHDCQKHCLSGSCCDGLDNDHDGHADLEDEACGCADGQDNDGDEYIDGDDFECQPDAEAAQ